MAPLLSSSSTNAGSKPRNFSKLDHAKEKGKSILILPHFSFYFQSFLHFSLSIISYDLFFLSFFLFYFIRLLFIIVINVSTGLLLDKIINVQNDFKQIIPFNSSKTNQSFISPYKVDAIQTEIFTK